MAYVDGFIVPIPKRKVAAYRKLARIAAKVWMDHGALGFHECLGDDVPYGKRTSFPRAVKLKGNETVMFSWILFRSRAHRDRVNKKVMADKRFDKMVAADMPFDGKRMIYGGFKSIVEA